MKEKAVGISISEGVIKIAILSKENEKVAVEGLEEIPFDSFDTLKENKQVHERLKTILSQNRAGSNVFVSMPDYKVVVRVKTTPKLPEAKIIQIIHAEIKDYAIFSRENVTFGLVTSKEDKDSKLVLWGGAKETEILNTLKFLRKCSTKTKNIMPSNVALAKYVSTFFKENGAFCTINLDRDTTTLTFVLDGGIVFTYMQDVGYKAFLDVDTGSQNTWSGNITTTIAYVARNLNIPISSVFFTQTLSKDVGAFDLLKQRINYPVYELTIPETIGLENEEDYIKIQVTRGNDFAVPIGLALFGLYKDNLPLKLLLNEYLLRERQSERIKLIALIVSFVAVNGAFALSYPFIRDSLENSQANLKKIETSISEISQTVDKVDSLTKELQSAKDTLSKYTSIKDTFENMPKFSKVLNEIYAKCPTRVSVLDVAVRNDGTVVLRGSSASFAAVFDFEKNLSTATNVEKASIGDVTKKEDGSGYTFNMEMYVKRSAK